METRRRDHIVAGWDDGTSGTVIDDSRVFHLEHIWGTVVTFDLPGSETGPASEAIAECLGFFRQVDATFSTYKALSEVSLFRNGLNRPGRSSDLFEVVMADCRSLRTFTGGAFDPWAVPGGYDPSGYVKGWAVGIASSMLSDAGIVDHLINAGGDIACRGNEDGVDGGWRVGILDPRTKADIIESVTLSGEAIATSGRYERGNHVVDPRTGKPCTLVDSVSIIGPECGLADAFASAAFVDGPERTMAWFASLGPEWSIHMLVGDDEYTHGPAFGEAS